MTKQKRDELADDALKYAAEYWDKVLEKLFPNPLAHPLTKRRKRGNPNKPNRDRSTL